MDAGTHVSIIYLTRMCVIMLIYIPLSFMIDSS